MLCLFIFVIVVLSVDVLVGSIWVCVVDVNDCFVVGVIVDVGSFVQGECSCHNGEINVDGVFVFEDFFMGLG